MTDLVICQQLLKLVLTDETFHFTGIRETKPVVQVSQPDDNTETRGKHAEQPVVTTTGHVGEKGAGEWMVGGWWLRLRHMEDERRHERLSLAAGFLALQH